MLWRKRQSASSSLLKSKIMNNEKKNTATTFDGGVTEQKIESWKQQYGKVVRVDVVDGEEMHIGYFHRPDLKTMAAVTKVAKTDEVKSSEVLWDNCWLGGSERMREDAVLFLAAIKQLGDMMNGCMASIKNL